MAVTSEDVRRVAALARLELSEAEVEGLVRDLGEILGHVEALDGVEGGGDRGRDRDRDRGRNRAGLRGDEPGADSLSDGPGAFAPAFEDGLFLVPRLASHGSSAGAGADVRESLGERPDGAADADGDGDADGDADGA